MNTFEEFLELTRPAFHLMVITNPVVPWQIAEESIERMDNGQYRDMSTWNRWEGWTWALKGTFKKIEEKHA